MVSRNVGIKFVWDEQPKRVALLLADSVWFFNRKLA